MCSLVTIVDHLVIMVDEEKDLKIQKRIIITMWNLLQTYYITVNASTDDGYVLGSSDGLTILPVDVPIEELEVMDGFPCPPAGN